MIAHHSTTRPFVTGKQRHNLNLFAERVIFFAGGVLSCLFLTIHFHNTLDVIDTPSTLRPPIRPRPQHPAVADDGVAAASDGAPPRHAGNAGHAVANGRAAASETVRGGTPPVPPPQPPPPLTPLHLPPPPSRRPGNARTRPRAAAGRTETAASAEEGVSACLLVNDENPRLPEWIAYHYLTLPLRALIVAVDPDSRSSPNEILLQWLDELGLQVNPWSERKYLPREMRGPCESDDPKKCLWRHRDRQQYFVMKCMAEFKSKNKTWVLLTDVDEYLVFNRIREDDPAAPLDEAPEGIPTVTNWKFHNSDAGGAGPKKWGGQISGTVDGKFVRSDFIHPKAEIGYGSVVQDAGNRRYFLRDDAVSLEAAALHEAPAGVPTLRDPLIARNEIYARIYDDAYDGAEDGSYVPIKMDWEIGDQKRRMFYGGHLTTDAKGREYYLENEQELWPPRYSAKDSTAARRRLPSVGEGGTILDVLRREARESDALGALGPCLSIPRLLYGSREDENGTPREGAAHERFDDEDFVTLRYRWHASKGEFEASKFGKTIIDVSRVPMNALRGKALNIHRPLPYYCRKDPARYALSLFRVNHYLDSFEAYSYRNDARSNLRQCKECYEKKGNGAAVAMEDDIQPWLSRFVELVGYEKAERLLSGAGDFVKLKNNTTT